MDESVGVTKKDQDPTDPEKDVEMAETEPTAQAVTTTQEDATITTTAKDEENKGPEEIQEGQDATKMTSNAVTKENGTGEADAAPKPAPFEEPADQDTLQGAGQPEDEVYPKGKLKDEGAGSKLPPPGMRRESFTQLLKSKISLCLTRAGIDVA